MGENAYKIELKSNIVCQTTPSAFVHGKWMRMMTPCRWIANFSYLQIISNRNEWMVAINSNHTRQRQHIMWIDSGSLIEFSIIFWKSSCEFIFLQISYFFHLAKWLNTRAENLCVCYMCHINNHNVLISYWDIYGEAINFESGKWALWCPLSMVYAVCFCELSPHVSWSLILTTATYFGGLLFSIKTATVIAQFPSYAALRNTPKSRRNLQKKSKSLFMFIWSIRTWPSWPKPLLYHVFIVDFQLCKSAPSI